MAIDIFPTYQVVSSLKGSVGEVGGVVRRCREVLVSLEAANTLLQIHNLLDEAHQAQLNHAFLTTAENLAKVSYSICPMSCMFFFSLTLQCLQPILWDGCNNRFKAVDLIKISSMQMV